MARFSEKLMELHSITTLSEDLISGASDKLKENRAILKRIKERQQQIYQKLIDEKGDEDTELYVVKIVGTAEHVSDQDLIVGNSTQYKKAVDVNYTAHQTRNHAIDHHWKRYAQRGELEPEPMEFVPESHYLVMLENHYKGENRILNRITKLLS